MSEKNQSIYRRLLDEAFNQGNLAVAEELVATNYINRSDNVRGVKQYKHIIRMFRSAISNLKVVIVNQSNKGDQVVTRWKAIGTHQSELMGIPPSGKKIIISMNSTATITDGQVAEEWCNSFSLGLKKPFDIIPDPSLVV